MLHQPIVANGALFNRAKATGRQPAATSIPLSTLENAIITRKGCQTLVELRVAFVKILQVDTVNERYQADIYLQARWREPKFDHCKTAPVLDPSSIWNPRLYIENIIGDTRESISREVQFPKGESVAYIKEKRRIRGMFLETLELRHFPFDCQDLSVCVTSELSHEDVELVECPRELSRVNTQAFVDSQEWDLHHHVDIERFDRNTDCDVGPKKRSCMQFTCRASRRFGFFLFNNVVISILLCLLSFASFSVPFSNIHGRLQLSFLLLLTTITFKVVTSQNLPKISYLTYLDKLLMGNLTVLVIICVWHAGITQALTHIGSEMIRIEHIFMGCFAGIYVIGIILFCIIIYFDAGARRREMKVKDRKFLQKAKQLTDNELFITYGVHDARA